LPFCGRGEMTITLKENLDKLHTTNLGIERIKRNLSLDIDDVVSWCKSKIKSPKALINRKGKNWYVNVDDFVSRFFAPNTGIDEDSVTGRVHCTLIPYWLWNYTLMP
jgi:hypothetical protein